VSEERRSGFTQIDNDLFEAIIGFGFTHRQQSVMLALVRKLNGYGKRQDDISASQISDLCKVPRQHVATTLVELERMNVINKAPGRFGLLLSINENSHVWQKHERAAKRVDDRPALELQIQQAERVSRSRTGVPIQVEGCPGSGHALVPNQDTQNKTSKENQKKGVVETAERFERFWNAYPKREGKTAALKAFTKVNPDDEMLDTMLAAISAQTKANAWTRERRQFIPHPATWLNGERWTDEVDARPARYTREQQQVIEAYNEIMASDGIWPTEPPMYFDHVALAIDSLLSRSSGDAESAAAYFEHCKTTAKWRSGNDLCWLLRNETVRLAATGQLGRLN
jgi:phage replication O-like protein O